MGGTTVQLMIHIMDRYYYNLSDLCLLPKKNVVNVSSTLQRNMKNVSTIVKDAQLKQCVNIAMQCQEVVPVSFISTFHNDIMVAGSKRGKAMNKPRCIK